MKYVYLFIITIGLALSEHLGTEKNNYTDLQIKKNQCFGMVSPPLSYSFYCQHLFDKSFVDKKLCNSLRFLELSEFLCENKLLSQNSSSIQKKFLTVQ